MMPRPRFERLAVEKRERILEAAAKEFTARGYDGASLNRILEEAEVSKGAAYYYFDDKADLYATAVQHYSQELLAATAFDPALLTAENFWEAITEIYRQQFTHFGERPWVFGVVKAGGASAAELFAEGPLAEMMEQAQFLLLQLIRHGRALGVIRDDMPEDLLLSLIVAVDDAHDRWLYAHAAELAAPDLEASAVRIGNVLRRVAGSDSIY
jgi:AcrR family transcriptional regulator